VLDALMIIVGSMEALCIEFMNNPVAVVMMSKMIVLYLMMVEGKSKHLCACWD